MKARIDNISAAAYTIPTDRPEADGTLAWDKTTIVIAFIESGSKTGMGYSYAASADTVLIDDTFGDLLTGMDAIDISSCWHTMRHAARNLGLRGQVASTIAAIDTALWDLKAKLLGVSLATLMGSVRAAIPVYGSGGFTTYGEKEITDQIEGWKQDGITMAKIKIGTHPEQDAQRVAWARQALGPDNRLFVDANGAYTAKQALAFAQEFRAHGVSWFEEPVSSDHLDALHMIREQGPPGMAVAAGEYGYDVFYFRRMLEAGAVDVLQLDATRCQGYTGFIHAASVAMAYGIPVSSHCAPALHLPVCCHVPGLQHMEYFYDHVRIEKLIFDNVPQVKNGCLEPDQGLPGHGLVFKRADAERFAA